MGAGFEVDPPVLKKASTDIIGCVEPAQGMDLEDIVGNGESYGHDGVFEAIAKFCPTWQIAITLLTQRSVSAGEALFGVAQRYLQVDESGGQMMKQVESNLPPS